MKLLTILILAVSLITCANNSYEDYTPGLVVSSVEYDGMPFSLGCTGDFKCEKKAINCVVHYHQKAQQHINAAVRFLKAEKENIPVITEFFSALCNLFEVKLYLGVLKRENKDEWLMLEEKGLIKQTEDVSLMLALKIRELQSKL